MARMKQTNPKPKKRSSRKQRNKNAKKYKFKKGTVALREIRKYQKSTEDLIARKPFSRLVRELIEEITEKDYFRISANAMLAL